MSEYVTALAIVLAGMVAIPTYLVQKSADRKYDLYKKKADSYQRYFDVFWEVRQQANKYRNGSPEHKAAHNTYDKALHDVYVLASDKAFLAISDFHNYVARNPIRTPEVIEVITEKYTDMIIAVRQDGFHRTRLTNKEIRSRLTFTA